MKDNQTPLDFKKLARRVKWRRWLITILIVLLATPLTLAAGYKWMQQLAGQNVIKENAYLDKVQTIMAPNIQISDQYLENTTVTGGQVVSHRYKVVEGQHVAWSPIVANYSWYQSSLPNALNATDQEHQAVYDRVTQNRIPLFFNVNRQDRKGDLQPTQELGRLAKTQNHVAEVALTFKHPMTYRQIQAKLPARVHAAWYWIGVSGTADTTHMDNDYLGVQADNAQGELTPATYRVFQKAARRANQGGASLGFDHFNVFQYASEYAQQHPTLAKAQFSGVIVTGTSAGFKQFGTPSWVAASSVGYYHAQAAF